MDLKQLRNDPAAWHILEERARALMIQDAAATTEHGDACLTFRLGDGGYSIPAQFIREVQPLGDYTPLPNTPAFVVGLVSVRGRLIAVLDLRPLLDLPQTPLQANAFLLILTVNGTEVGLLADVVVEVRRNTDVLTPAPSTTAGHGVAWVRGVDRDLTLRLDPPALVADSRLIVNVAAH